MTTIKKFEYLCSVCENIAGKITIGERKEDDSIKDYPLKPKFFVKIEGPFSNPIRFINYDEYSWIRNLLEKNRFQPFYEKYQDNVSFFCPKCFTFYCRSHWSNFRLFMDQGFYDYSSAVCPKGHEVIVDD